MAKHDADRVLNENKKRKRGQVEGNIYFKPLDELTEEEKEKRREHARQASAKAAETRKQNRTMRECLLTIMDAEVASKEQREMLKKKFGVTDEFISNKMLVNLALFKKALTGDVAAYKQIADMIGVENNIPVNQVITINLVAATSDETKPATLDFEDKEDWLDDEE